MSQPLKRQLCRTAAVRNRTIGIALLVVLYFCWQQYLSAASHGLFSVSVLDLNGVASAYGKVEHQTLDANRKSQQKIVAPKLHKFQPAGKSPHPDEPLDRAWKQKWLAEKQKAKAKGIAADGDDTVAVDAAAHKESTDDASKPELQFKVQVDIDPATLQQAIMDQMKVGAGKTKRPENAFSNVEKEGTAEDRGRTEPVTGNSDNAVADGPGPMVPAVYDDSNEDAGSQGPMRPALDDDSNKEAGNQGSMGPELDDDSNDDADNERPKGDAMDSDENGTPEHGSVGMDIDVLGHVVAEQSEVEQEADTVAVDSLAEKDADAEILAGAGATYHAGHPGPAHPSIPSTRFLLMRMVGNDLPPKHQVGQAYNNLKFILTHEPKLADCGKVWFVNRIIDTHEEACIIRLLAAHNQVYIRVPFNDTEFTDFDTRFEGYGDNDILRSRKFRKMRPFTRAVLQDDMEHARILYLMNINGVRNFMLEVGKKNGAEWILPFDGNTFFTRTGWEALRQTVLQQGSASRKYFAVPMARVVDNKHLLNADFMPEATEEPQLVFHAMAQERFNETLRYGRRSKLPLLERLGLRGTWSGPGLAFTWEKYMPFAYELSTDVPENDPVRNAGWVARLYSSHVEHDLAAPAERGLSSSKGVQLLLAKAAARTAHTLYGLTHQTLLAYNETVLAHERRIYRAGTDKLLAKTIRRLLRCADHALSQGPWSVLDKLDQPPSRDKHDYYTIKPYFWPNPHTQTGLPYIRIDGKRVPGTELYDEQSDRFDRTRLAALYGNTTCLALAHYFTGNDAYASKAADNVRHWFLDAATRMTPHSKYAQIQWGENDNLGESTGVIEFKDFYFFLDAVRLLDRADALTDDEMKSLRAWFREYRAYLERSNQGQWEYLSSNNHGLYFEVQMAAINAFLDELPRFVWQMSVARGRILSQFAADGSLPHEMTRRTQLHYMMFTLQGWYTLARIASNAGIDYWRFKREDDLSPPLKRGAVFTVPYFNRAWRHYQETSTDMQRMLPLYYAALSHYPQLAERPQAPHLPPPPPLYAVKPLFHEHDGIQPFWNLGLTDAYL